MYDEIKRCPGALVVIPSPVNYFSKLQEARQNAAEEHYAAGILSLQGKSRDDAKLAYGYFKTANEYVAGYKEVNDYLKAALAAATVKILVEPIPVHSKSAGVSAEFFNDKISEFVHSAPISEFVKFYTKAEVQKMKVSPDHIIQLQFDDFTVGQVYRHEKEIQLSRDSVVMGSYVSPTTATHTDNNASSSNRAGLAVNATGVLASSGTKVSTQPSGTTTSPVNATAEAERQKALAAEKQRAEQEAAERQRAAQEASERERLAKEAAERERAAKEAADKALADKIAAEKALAEKTRAENEQLERDRIEKERAQQALADKIRAEKEQADRAQAEKERLEREAAEQRAAAEKANAERERAERERIEKEKVEKERLEKEKIEKEKLEKEKLEKEKLEKEKIEKEKLEREKLEKEKAEKEKIEKEKADKNKYIDPTINAEDTLNVKDGVLVCHIPPGNKTNARTLKINRAALKAHLAHGDIEGGCAQESNEEKGKPVDQPKGKPAPDEKEKNNKGKGPGGSASVEHPSKGPSFLLHDQQLLIASATGDPSDMFRYLYSSVAADTNKVYGTVKATLYHYTKTTTSKGVVSFRIIDAKTGALLSSEKMPGEFVWKSEWATFNGDERALSADQLRLSKLKELPPPAPQDLFIEFTRPIYDQITTKIKDFYKHY
jgi:hypothetical protein